MRASYIAVSEQGERVSKGGYERKSTCISYLPTDIKVEIVLH